MTRNNLMGLKAKKVSFNGSHGTDEDQLNRILEKQVDQAIGTGGKITSFHIYEIIPVDDRGHTYFWFLYSGVFPEKKVWQEKK